MIFAMSPSSAPAERVFSLLKLNFGKTQGSSLADYIEGSLMLAHNNTMRRNEA